MLPLKNRLTKEKDFYQVFKKGKSLREGCLFLWVVKNNLTDNRFGFVVGKNVSKKATIRNKVKRRLREIVHKELGELKQGLDVVVLTKPGIEKKTFLETKEAVSQMLERARIFSNQ